MRLLGAVLLVLTAATARAGDPFVPYEASGRAFARGLAAQERSAWPEAARAYERALKLDADFVEARVNLARVRLAQGNLDAARRGAERALRRHGDYPRGHTVRGLIALRQGNLNLALAALRRARVGAPDDVETLCALGATLLRLGVVLEARAPLLHALEIDPSCAPCAFDLALGFDRQSDFAHASFWYRRFLDLARSEDPEWAEVRTRLAEIGGSETESSHSSVARGRSK